MAESRFSIVAATLTEVTADYQVLSFVHRAELFEDFDDYEPLRF